MTDDFKAPIVDGLEKVLAGIETMQREYVHASAGHVSMASHVGRCFNPEARPVAAYRVSDDVIAAFATYGMSEKQPAEKRRDLGADCRVCPGDLGCCTPFTKAHDKALAVDDKPLQSGAKQEGSKVDFSGFKL